MTTTHSAPDGSTFARPRQVKCLVWDLDDTLWDGVLLEGGVRIRTPAADAIRALDRRGILQSIASKNEHEHAMQVLRDAHLDEFFLFPQIGWSSKAESIRRIAAAINIGADAIAFIDDQPFERDEVRFFLPDVLCIDATELPDLLSKPELSPRLVTEDAARRRLMYLSDIERGRAEEAFVGPKHEFLATLGMRLTIAPTVEGDLERAEELTVRTHQLNTTGYTYSYDELDALRRSSRHKLLVADFEDRYGSYGKIGLALLECGVDRWTLKLLLLSCRVMSRGIGSIMLHQLMALAREARVRLFAEFRANDRNRMMHMTLRLAGFKEVTGSGADCLLEADLDRQSPAAEHIEVKVC